jgi:hypothetical protein
LTQPILRIALSVSSSPVSQFDAKSPPGWVHEAAAGGALGGTLVSGALWGPWWQVPAWIAALVATAIAPTLALSGQPLGFMVGWSLFWGLLIGAVGEHDRDHTALPLQRTGEDGRGRKHHIGF